MKTGMKKLGWKSKAFLLYVAVELAVLPFAIPATAQIVERISFSIPQHVTAVELQVEPGLSRYFVASNAPFSIISEGAIGDLDVDIKVHGTVNGVKFGQKAQKPGILHACSSVTNTFPNVIYTGDQKTAAKRGKAIEQAIVVDVRHDPALQPKISFEPGDSKTLATMPKAQNCPVKNS